MALEHSLLTMSQTACMAALVGLPTTSSMETTEKGININTPGVGTTLVTTTTTTLVQPITPVLTGGYQMASPYEVRYAEAYLESLSDDELAELCESTDLLIERQETVEKVKTL